MNYRLKYHVMGETGWINDPNGFSYYQDYYHLFFQYYPHEPIWGPMHWGHVRSKDLVHWEYLPIALTPGDQEDLNGCFSGSAIEYNNRLYLIYTGNIYDDEDHLTFHQNVNIAYSEDGIHFHKYEHNPVISCPPSDNTHHFRDPKVMREDDHFKMIIGGQKEDGRGHVLIYQSYDLIQWEYLGEYKHASSIPKEGKMWECPDLFRLNGQDILLMSPQGIEEDGEKYRNYHQTGYIIKDQFIELDHGHDFYAATTMLAPDGRRILIAWMDMWHSEFPEKEEGWSGALTFPRELTIHDDHLYMMPVEELSLLRQKTVHKEIKEYLLDTKQLEIDASIEDDFYLEIKDASYSIHIKDHKVIVFNQTERTGRIKHYHNIKLLIDTSSIEVFINNGELVFTDRVYFKGDPMLIFKKKTLCKITTLS